jgi:30S ribosome assembly GTPase
MNKICYGCGAKLQTKDATLPGYIPKEKENGSYCQRCFRLIHYGINNETNAPKSIASLINSINKENKLVIFLIPFLTMRSDIIKIYKKITSPKILVISKIDIVPRSIKYTNIKNYLTSYYQIADEIKFISSVSNIGIKSLLNYLSENKINEIIIAGESNSGKSTLINKILEEKKNTLSKVTTSNAPNTTLDFIRINVSKDLNIIDTPGFILKTIELKSLNISKKYIKPITFQMKRDETLQLDSTYLFFTESTNITIYLNNDIPIKKYYKEIFFEESIDVPANNDLIIKGLGFINIKNATTIKLHNLHSDLLEQRPSIFGGLDE